MAVLTPDKLQEIIEWRKQNPKGTKADCNRATNIDQKKSENGGTRHLVFNQISFE